MGEPLRLQAEAYAFRQLVAHLQERTDVQNIDVMNLAGFCRNCLSKWYCAGAREHGMNLSYDDACEEVYGMPYPAWKKAHQTPATDEQMALFKKSSAGHAKHAPVAAAAAPAAGTSSPAPAAAAPAATPAADAPKKSSVCCQAVPEVCTAEPVDVLSLTPLRLSILTVSDRASAGVYEDLSGPEIETCVGTYARATNAYALTVVEKKVVPDEQELIAATLREWTAPGRAGGPNLVLTTGGTGLSQRDVTPEATLAVVQRLVPGITEVLRREGAKHVSFAVLSRSVAGVANETLVINLPGRPKACRESLNILLPLLQHAISEVTKRT